MDSQLVGLATVSFIFPEGKQVGCISTSTIAQIRSLQGALRVFLDIHGSLNVPIEHHPTIRYMVYNGYYKVMSNIPKMGHLPTPDICWGDYKTVLRCPTLSGMQLLKWQEQQPELNTSPQQYIRHVLFFPYMYIYIYIYIYIQNGTQTRIKMYQHKISLCVAFHMTSICWTSNVQMGLSENRVYSQL